MGDEMLEMVVKMRKNVIFTTRKCCRSVCSHPFLVCVVCLLVFLYRSSPLVFSLLVSASPVLVCTALLLGTLLSFGQPNIPEIERDERRSVEIFSLKTGLSGDTSVIEKNESYFVDKFNEKRGIVLGQLNGVASSIVNRTIELHRGGSVDSSAPLIEGRPREIGFENGVVAEEGRKIHDSKYELKNDITDGRLGHADDNTDDDEDLEMENDKSPAESFDSEMVNVDSLDSPPGSPWKHVEDREEDQDEQEEEDDEDTDSGSDGAESSSPDASMADIIPMLDELHPLLDEDAPHPVPTSHDASDAASEHSLKSNDSSSESNNNMEDDEQVEVADDENEDADDEDEAQGKQEGQMKSAITWTEEDQKNLMDLGTSELERNQRLESLIARRRARKTINSMAERNLIDLESADLPFGIAPISTARNNPFDLPHDSYDDMGLPPIPGSAPSILLARQNPFDLPYDSSEEKPDLLGDSFQQEFAAFQPREHFFRRHESFNVGPSFFGPSRQERQDGRLRPYFVAERMDSEGASYSSFQRQSSGLSDSKASSIPETDSVASAGDNEGKNIVEENISLQAELLDSIPEMELRDSARGLDDKNLSDEDVSHESDLISMKEDTGEEEISQEQELISNIEHVSVHVGHGSQSSDETDSSELGEVENGDVEADKVEIGSRQMEDKDDGAKQVLFEEACISSPLELNATEAHSSGEAAKQVYRSTSSSSSLSEVSERLLSEREGGGLSNLEERRDNVVEDTDISIQPHEGSHFNMTSDTPQKEPVYDSSPTAVRKSLSSSSISSDLHVESEISPILIKRTVSFAERESESCSQDMGRSIFGDIDRSASMLHPIDESLSRSMLSVEATDNNIMRIDQVCNIASGPVVAESMIDYPSSDSKSTQEYSVEGDLMYQHGSEYLSNQSFLSVDTDVHLGVNNVLPPILDSMVTPDEKSNLSQVQSSLSMEKVLPVNVPSTGSQSLAEHSVNEEVALHPELREGPSIISDANDGLPVDIEEKKISVHNESASDERPIAEYGEELVFLDKSVDEASSSRQHHGGQDPVVTHEAIIEELSSTENPSILVAQEVDQEVSTNINSPTSPESISILSEAYECRAAEGFSDVESNCIHESGDHDQLLEEIRFSAEGATSLVNVQNSDDDADEIKELDEALLSELDAVGDFSIKDLGSSSNDLEKHVVVFAEEGSPNSIAVLTSNVVEVNPKMPLVEARSIEDIEIMLKKPELTAAQMVMHSQDEVDQTSSSNIPVLEAQTLLDVDSEFKQKSGANDKTDITESFSAQLAIKEATASGSKHHKQHEGTSLTDPNPILEARELDDANLDDNHSHKRNAESNTIPNSIHDGLHVGEIKDLDQTSLELPVVETRYLDDHSLALKLALESDQVKVLQSNSVDVSAKFEENGADTLMNMQSTAQELGVHDLSNSDIENPESLNVDEKESENPHKSCSSSSSSTSTDSSSSDSDKE